MEINKESIQNMRTSYKKGALEKEDLSDDPMHLAKAWFQEAIDQKIYEANAMSLSTVSLEGQPTIRTVLLKGIDESGYIFYSNYHSRKAQEMEANPKAAILLFWRELERQIRIEGSIEKISEEASIEYFKSRPKGSQLGAWASPQSKVISDRSVLDDRLEELKTVYQNHERLPKPAHWGGYRLVPHYYEFWQGRESRLHDRFEYKKEDDDWVINRLAP